jgi:uncharacterized protein YllA (UPF0747 family)
MGLAAADLFRTTDAIKNSWIKKHSEHQLSLKEELSGFQRLFAKIRELSERIDPTLVKSAGAIEARLEHAMGNLEKKLIKAEKLNYQTRLEQIDQIKADLFPKESLQERSENFGLFYVKWGQVFIDELVRHFEPLEFKFTVLTE